MGKFTEVLQFHYGLLELFLIFITNRFPDVVWHKYKKTLREGFNVPFDHLADLCIESKGITPVLLTETIIHDDENSEELYVKKLAEHGNYVLEMNATGYPRRGFDRIINSILQIFNSSLSEISKTIVAS